MMPTIVSALPDLDRAGKKCFAVKESGGKKRRVLWWRLDVEARKEWEMNVTKTNGGAP
jgi:hypothetical protein